MNNEVLKKEHLYQLVLDNIPSYVFWKDRNSIYLGCNLKFAKSAGFNTPNEIVGKSDYELPWNKKDSDFYRKIDKEVMDSKIPQINFEESQTVQNKPIKWLRTSKIPLFGNNGEVIGILGMYEDITLRKQMELELINRNDKLKKLNSQLEMINIDLEQFAYATSHDLQEPLRMIGGFVGLLERKYARTFDDNALEYITYIKEGTQRMSSLIRQILSYSKLDDTECQNKTEFDLDFLMEEIQKDLDRLIKSKHASINIRLPKQKIRCQYQRIKMLFSNLIINGIKFNTSETPIIKIDYTETKDEWHFTVEDNGIGIQEKYQTQIFKPFKRLNRRAEFRGNGMGLSICKRIVYLHGGQIWFVSKEGIGTTFHFTILKE